MTGTGRRVTSVGARIEEPPAVAAATPEPTPEPTPAEVPEASPTESATTTPAEEVRPATRTPRGRRVPGRRTRTRPPVEQPAAAETETKPVTDSGVATEAEAPPASPASPTRRGAGRRRGTTPPVVQEPEVESGPRLVIETNDGTLIDRYMSSVRRVTVENGRVVVIGKDGTIHRIPLANVVRMVIAP